MATLAYTRSGAGTPLVLLHALGLSRRIWDPVIPALSEQFDVLAVDLPGFGDSAPLPPTVEALPSVLAAEVGDLLDQLGVGRAHIVGNSLGGWVGLELAQLRPAASLTLLSPAGLWSGRTPLYCRVSLRASRWLARHAAHSLSRVVSYRLGRNLVLGQTHGRPGRMPVDRAREEIHELGTSQGFDAALSATAPRHYRAGSPIDAPVTVAFGSRDRLLLRRQSRRLGELPAHTRVGELPGCGHVPSPADAPAVIALITASAARRSEVTQTLAA
jgi:pimeloyl-ACP methyl ester carboxylesterase